MMLCETRNSNTSIHALRSSMYRTSREKRLQSFITKGISISLGFTKKREKNDVWGYLRTTDVITIDVLNFLRRYLLRSLFIVT